MEKEAFSRVGDLLGFNEIILPFLRLLYWALGLSLGVSGAASNSAGIRARRNKGREEMAYSEVPTLQGYPSQGRTQALENHRLFHQLPKSVKVQRP